MNKPEIMTAGDNVCVCVNFKSCIHENLIVTLREQTGKLKT